MKSYAQAAATIERRRMTQEAIGFSKSGHFMHDRL